MTPNDVRGITFRGRSTGSGLHRSVFEAAAAGLPEGLVLEMGTGHGHSTWDLCECLNRKVHTFDWFHGLPEDWNDENPRGAFSRDGVPPMLPELAEAVVGRFEDTLPAFLASHGGPVAWLSVDCDLYAPAKLCLSLVLPRMAVGGVVYFDELLDYKGWESHEALALAEVIDELGCSLEPLFYTPYGCTKAAFRVARPQGGR